MEKKTMTKDIIKFPTNSNKTEELSEEETKQELNEAIDLLENTLKAFISEIKEEYKLISETGEIDEKI